MSGGSEKKKEETYKKRGSFSVEAVFVVPLCLLVLFFVLQIFFYVHHVSWYTAAAWECALSQMQKGPDRETADDCWQKIRGQQPLPVSGVRETADESETSVKVTIRGRVLSAYGLPEIEFKAAAARKQSDPAKQLRQSRLKKQMLKE